MRERYIRPGIECRPASAELPEVPTRQVVTTITNVGGDGIDQQYAALTEPLPLVGALRTHISPPVSRWPAPVNINVVTPPGLKKASVPVAPIVYMVLWFSGGRLIACWSLQAATSDLSLARP